MSECPTSAIPKDIWDTIDLFWLCNVRTPGFSSWNLVRASLPHEGPILSQDNWLMWAFGVLESEFYTLQNDLSEEKASQKNLANLHEKTKRDNR